MSDDDDVTTTAITRPAVALLAHAGVRLGPGLTEAQLVGVEARFRFRFNPAHRHLLATSVPLGEQWVNWLQASDAELTRRLAGPVEGALFDVAHNDFWARSWGPRPADEQQALQAAREQLELLPVLVPLYSHRYLPASPAPENSPVFSVHQTDVIYYGVDLLDYFEREFLDAGRDLDPLDISYRVPFWSELAEGYEGDEI
ncbi:hypothetical protein BH10ACT8_BH10ACT8_12960 [soil metagenome]